MKRDEALVFLSHFKAMNREKYQIRKIGFFGSVARDGAGENSDVDVVVELDEPDLFHLIGIKQDIEAHFRRPVDIVRYRDTMNEFLKKRIDQEAVYV